MQLHSYLVWNRHPRKELCSMSFLQWSGWDAVQPTVESNQTHFCKQGLVGYCHCVYLLLWWISLLKVLRRHGCKPLNVLTPFWWKIKWSYNVQHVLRAAKLSLTRKGVCLFMAIRLDGGICGRSKERTFCNLGIISKTVKSLSHSTEPAI